MKRKLLFAIVALMCSVGLNAQKDVTSQYITNATLSSLTGWTVSNFNTPVNATHQNVNNDKIYSNATAGYASESYAGWGSLEKTSYSLTQTITLPAGHYTLVNYSFFRQGQSFDTNNTKSLAFLKAGNSQVAIKTLGSITAAGYANSQWEGAACFDSKMYRNTLDFEITADNTQIEIGLVGTFDEMKSWCIVGQFELINNDTPATMDSPFDVTGYITNPGFEYRDMTGWTLSENGAFGTQNNNQSFKTAWYYAEKWQASGALTARSFSQTLTDLPAGYYKLTANLGGNGTYIDLNGKKASWTEDKDYTVGYVLAENEDLTITAGKTAEGTANWIHFDNFRLQFCGDVAAALTTLCDQVSSYEGTIPTAAYNQLVSDVAAKNQTYSDVDELLAAIDDVQDLYDAADLLKPNYTAWLEMKGLADALVAVDNNNSEANSTFASAITAQNTAANNSTTAADIATATANLKAAMVTYVGAADPTSGNRFELTFMIAVPDMTDLWTGAWGVTPEGWATEQEGGNFQVMQNNDADAEDGIHKVFTEYYYLNNNTTWGNNKFNVYTTIDNLPVGTYTMSCYAFAKEQNYSSGAANPQVFFYANNTQGSLVNNSRLQEKSISFINDEQQDVKVGLKPLAGNTLNWMGIGYVKLYKEYTDNTTYDINTGVVTNGSVAVTVDDVVATAAKALKTVTLTYTPDEGYYVSSVVASYNDGEEKTLDVANPSTNVYTFQMPAYDVTVTSSVLIDKRALATAISSATNARKAVNEGTGIFQIPATAGSTLATAITTAQGVYDDEDATVSEINSATTTMNTAITTYENTTLNAPDSEKRYKLILADRGALSFDATGAADEGGYGLPYSAAADYKAQTFFLTQVTGNNYKLSFEDFDGNTRYICKGENAKAGLGNNKIRTTTDAEKALEIKIAATSTANVFNMLNTADSNNKLGSDGGGMYTANNYTSWSITEASQASVSVNLAAGKYGTRIFPFAPGTIDGIKFYSCENVEGERAQIDEVVTPEANKPYILKATKDVETELSGWGTAVADSYTEGWLTGVYTATTIAASVEPTAEDDGAYRYVLQTQDAVQAFYKVDAEFTATAYRAYLTVPVEKTGGGVKALFLDFGDATGINTVQGSGFKVQDSKIFNLAGQRMSKMQKGVNIVNGKKVLVK